MKAEDPTIPLLEKRATDMVEEEALRRFARAINRSRALFKPSPIVLHKPIKDRKDVPDDGKQGSRTTPIALISQLNPFKNLPHADEKLKSSDKGGRLSGVSFDHFEVALRSRESNAKALELWLSKLKKQYRDAASESEFVISNELSFPSFWPGHSYWRGHDGYIDKKTMLKMQIDFENYLQSISTDSNSIIIPGSYHDWHTFEGVSPIKFPNPEDSFDHVKRTSARRAGEFISIPREREYPIYNYGNLAFFRFDML